MKRKFLFLMLLSAALQAENISSSARIIVHDISINKGNDVPGLLATGGIPWQESTPFTPGEAVELWFEGKGLPQISALRCEQYSDRIADAALEYFDGTSWKKSALVFFIRPQAEAFYRFSFQVNTQSACRIAILTTQKGTTSYLFFPVKPGSRFATTYLYAQNDAPIIGRLYLDQTDGATRVEVKDFKVAKLTEEELSGNLFPDGEFENGAGADYDTKYWIRK